MPIQMLLTRWEELREEMGRVLTPSELGAATQAIRRRDLIQMDHFVRLAWFRTEDKVWGAPVLNWAVNILDA